MVNLSNLNFVKTPISMDAKSNGRNHANLKNGSTDVDGSYILDIDTEKGKSEAPKSIQEMGGNVKTDDCIAVSSFNEFNNSAIITCEDIIFCISKGIFPTGLLFLYGIILISNLVFRQM